MSNHRQRDLAEQPAEKAHGVQVQLTLEQLLAATHEYAQPLPHGVAVLAQHYQEHYTRHLCGQVGPVCAAASVSGALNVINGMQAGPGAFRVRDTMRIYQLMFHDQRTEALSKLAKVVKLKDTQCTSACDLFCCEDICLAARGRNRFCSHLHDTQVAMLCVSAVEFSV